MSSMMSYLRCSFSSSFLLRISSTSRSTSSLNGHSDGTPGSFLRLLYLPGFFRFSARAYNTGHILFLLSKRVQSRDLNVYIGYPELCVFWFQAGQAGKYY